MMLVRLGDGYANCECHFMGEGAALAAHKNVIHDKQLVLL